MSTQSCIHGLGYQVPERILSNAELERMVDTSDEWITSRTGISERRMVEEGQSCSDLAYGAAVKALSQANIAPQEVTHILVGTFSPDQYIPSSACLLQKKLGNTTAACMDISAACSGFLYSLETARGLVALHPDAVILVVGSEVVTSRVNFEDRTTCVLFGDGAGAAVVSASNASPSLADIVGLLVRADGRLSDLLTVSGGGSGFPPKLGGRIDESYFVQMQGREVFKHAVRNMERISLEILEQNGLRPDEIDIFIPHQANYRIIDALAKRLEYPRDKIYVNLDRFGNTSAASIPLALAEAWERKAINQGDKVLLSSFGGGFTWASALLQF